MASTDPMTRRFAVACGVLSQYVKANSSQPSTAAPVAQGVSGLMAAAAAAAAAPPPQVFHHHQQQQQHLQANPANPFGNPFAAAAAAHHPYGAAAAAGNGYTGLI